MLSSIDTNTPEIIPFHGISVCGDGGADNGSVGATVVGAVGGGGGMLSLRSTPWYQFPTTVCVGHSFPK